MNETLIGTWTEYHVFTDGEGAEVRGSTNDDNDDGFPDGDISTWKLKFPNLHAALRHTGKTRRGLYGQPVRVFVDGKAYPEGSWT